ncbi:ATPase/histidine kinase/DNA gyrase B/HSP90 domain protein [Clostridium sp. KLE 1755]|jgi:signal transduction histidine kinase|uniref:sensor histidine kinase n=1 Tax=Eisenbergiella porci TaxID=2652274 RepID=UPI0003967723|nr:ATPase/histidine kinase/DNA gyrase B/HSP90 domain protein [Clostridium sp. KLE 1755]
MEVEAAKMLTRLKKLFMKIPALRSMKVYIFFLMLVMGILPSFIMRVGILQSYEERAVNLRISDTQTQFKIIANHLLNNNYLQDTSNEAINAELEQMSNLYDGRVIIINGNFRIVKDTYSISEGKTIISEEVIRCFKGESTTRYDKENGYIEMTIPIEAPSSGKNQTTQADAGKKPEQSQVVGVMLASVSTDSIATTMEILNRKALIIEIVMIICIFGVAVGFSSILVKPFNRVTQAITEVKDGFTDEPIAVPDYIETEHIIDAFNQLLTQMKVIDDSRQEFVSNVSHELKTPLTSMKVLADSLMQQEDAPLELYQEFMQDIANEIERENKIINDLLSLVKMDKTAAQMNITAVDINELIESVLKRLRPIARLRDVEVTFESIRPVTAEIDEVKITQVFTNLVENAIKYNKEHGWVKVLLDADHQFFTVEISDSGIGIPEADYDHIFERFYRVDKSHSREIGGTGLGLAITRNAILLHRGSVKVASTEGEGTSFTVKIPLTYVR